VGRVLVGHIVRPARQDRGPHALRKTGRANTVQAGRELSRSGFGSVTFDLFFYFPNILKSLQIQKFVYDSFELENL
jgi:hypothetical protein